jgi:hypothetical protein
VWVGHGRFQHCSGSVSRGLSPNRTCDSHRIRLSTCRARCSSGGWLGDGPGGWYPGSEVAGDRDAGCAAGKEPRYGRIASLGHSTGAGFRARRCVRVCGVSRSLSHARRGSRSARTPNRRGPVAQGEHLRFRQLRVAEPQAMSLSHSRTSTRRSYPARRISLRRPAPRGSDAVYFCDHNRAVDGGSFIPDGALTGQTESS